MPNDAPVDVTTATVANAKIHEATIDDYRRWAANDRAEIKGLKDQLAEVRAALACILRALEVPNA